VIDSAIVYPTVGNGFSTDRNALDAMEGTIGHEDAEIVTDPKPGSGWVDAEGNELGDETINKIWPNILQCDSKGNAEQSLWVPSKQEFGITTG
jgi:hypothetical protein